MDGLRKTNSQQISNIAESNYRMEGAGTPVPQAKTSQFSYDANGNLLSINTSSTSGGGGATNRKLLWDEENHLLASSDNGFVTSYFYDAGGERTVKMSGDAEGVKVNGLISANRTSTNNFSVYISPYMIVRNGGEYTKNIYMGSQRITSKVSNSGIFATSPVNTTDLQAKYAAQTAALKGRYDSLGVAYNATSQTGSLISQNPSTSSSSYFYHSDHLGSSSLITDQLGAIVQHMEYVPYGETFIDERRSASSWTTPYLFCGKERDTETGLLYVSQRYQDGKYGIWYSVDPLAEKYPNMSSYVYCADNPIRFVDPDGRKWLDAKKDGAYATKLITAMNKQIESNNKQISRYEKNSESNAEKISELKANNKNLNASITEIGEMGKETNSQVFTFKFISKDEGTTQKRSDGVIEMTIANDGRLSNGVHESSHGYDFWISGKGPTESNLVSGEIKAYQRQFSFDSSTLPNSYWGDVDNIKDINGNWVYGVYKDVSGTSIAGQPAEKTRLYIYAKQLLRDKYSAATVERDLNSRKSK